MLWEVMHFDDHGQWWSIESKQTPQSMQCSTLVHLTISQILQYDVLVIKDLLLLEFGHVADLIISS